MDKEKALQEKEEMQRRFILDRGFRSETLDLVIEYLKTLPNPK